MAKSSAPESELVDLALLAVVLGGGELDSTSALAKLVKRPLDHAVTQGLVVQTVEKRPASTASDKPRQQTVKRYSLAPPGHARLGALPDPGLRELGSTFALQQLRSTIGDAIDQLRSSVVQQIDEGASVLAQKLAGVGGPSESSPAPLADQLAHAYRALCRRVEYEDGLVDIPRLYRRLRQDLPGVSADAVKDELHRRWKAGELELRVLNEVDTTPAEERAFGIPHSGALYFYVNWPTERP